MQTFGSVDEDPGMKIQDLESNTSRSQKNHRRFENIILIRGFFRGMKLSLDSSYIVDITSMLYVDAY